MRSKPTHCEILDERGQINRIEWPSTYTPSPAELDQIARLRANHGRMYITWSFPRRRTVRLVALSYPDGSEWRIES